MTATVTTPDDLAPLQQQMAGFDKRISALEAAQAAPPPPNTGSGSGGGQPQPAAVAAAFPASLLIPRSSVSADYSFGAGRTVPDLATVKTFFDPHYPNGDVTLTGNSECEIYDVTWGHHVLEAKSIALVAEAVRPIVGTSAFSTADLGAIKSAMLSTKSTFNGGYFEVRAKVPPAASKGAWPAAWITVGVQADPAHPDWWPPEVDLFEIANNSGDAINADGNAWPTFGVISAGPVWQANVVSSKVNQWNGYAAGVDLGLDFHVFGLEWIKDSSGKNLGDRFRRYLDGVLVHDMVQRWCYADNTPAAAAHFYLDLAYGGTWAGRNGINPAGLPCAYEIDYLRVFA